MNTIRKSSSIITATMSSYTFTLTGNSTRLSCNIFPEVILDEISDYSCALSELTTYQSIPNVIKDQNNQFYYYKKANDTSDESDGQDLHLAELSTGSYEAKEILEFIKHHLYVYDISFQYTVNKNTFKTKIVCSTALYIGDKFSNNILKNLLGYSQNKTIEPNQEEESQDIIKISSQDIVRVECNITSGSYTNGVRNHTIYEFATYKVDVGYKIVERPRNLIYLPVTHKRLNHIEISLVDQNGEPIDFRGETVTCRIHIKKD